MSWIGEETCIQLIYLTIIKHNLLLSYLHHLPQQNSSNKIYNSHNIYMKNIISIKVTYQENKWDAFFNYIFVFTSSYRGIYKFDVISLQYSDFMRKSPPMKYVKASRWVFISKLIGEYSLQICHLCSTGFKCQQIMSWFIIVKLWLE